MSGQSTPQRTLTTYVGAGCSPTVALDLFMVRDEGMPVSAWAAIRGRDPSAIEHSIKAAGDVFASFEPCELLEARR